MATSGLTGNTLIEGFSLDGTPSPGATIALERLRLQLIEDAATIAAQQYRSMTNWVTDHGNGTVTVQPNLPITPVDGPGTASIGI